MMTRTRGMKIGLAMALLCCAVAGPGCSGDGTRVDARAPGDGPGAEAGATRIDLEIGKACSGASQCARIPSGYCDSSDNTCTRKCKINDDCGCAPGITEAEIAQGKCRAACVYTLGIGHCFRACQSSTDCASGTRCNPLAGTSFSICE